MDSKTGGWVLAALVGAAMLFGIGMCAGGALRGANDHQEALDEGHIEYFLNERLQPEWRWKKCDTCAKQEDTDE